MPVLIVIKVHNTKGESPRRNPADELPEPELEHLDISDNRKSGRIRKACDVTSNRDQISSNKNVEGIMDGSGWVIARSNQRIV